MFKNVLDPDFVPIRIDSRNIVRFGRKDPDPKQWNTASLIEFTFREM